MKRFISGASIASLLALTSLLSASMVSAQDSGYYLPDVVIFNDYATDYVIDYTDFNNYSDYGPIPLGGNSDPDYYIGDALYIGGAIPFDGISIDVNESRMDGEYVLSYFSSDQTWVEIEGGTLTELTGTVEVTWDNSELDWEPAYITYDYSATDPDNSGSDTYTAYYIKLETLEQASESGYAWADAIYVILNDIETTEETTEEEEEEETTPVEVTTISTPTFSDLPSYHDNFAAIEYLVHIGTLQGYSDGTFQPDNTVNRAELMKILVAGQEIDPDADTYKNCFPDVTTEWFAPYVCYAKEQGWVSGYPDGTFLPGNTVNKAEALKMVINGLGFGENVPESLSYGSVYFNDVQSTDWYAPYVYLAYQMNMIEEKYLWSTENMYYPGDGMTRAEVSENVFRGWVVNQLDGYSYTLADRYTFFEQEGFDVVETEEPYEETTQEETYYEEEDDSVYLNLTSSSSDMTLTIENLGDSTVNLSGYSLETSSTFYTFGSYELAPGETVELDYYYPGETVYLRNDGGGIIETDYNF